MIQVTKTWLPPLEEYTARLRGVWERGWITNNGQLVQELEEQLRRQLGVGHLKAVANGTLALQLALKALGVRGEVITTPFSYVATTGSLLWEGCTPVFVDIEPKTLCLDPALVEAAITPRTMAILATHVYGYPCDVEALAVIARRHGLKVIYDAAHAFGTRYQGRALCDYGDASTLSFHATKLFHTVEGGAVVTRSPESAERIELMRSFGHRADDHICPGINAKMSEPHAAMGLCLLPRVEGFIAARRQICAAYDRLLLGTTLERPHCPPGCDYNHAYYPILFPGEPALLNAVAALVTAGIRPRRYFWPALNELPYVRGQRCPVAESAARRALCLPLHVDLDEGTVRRIAGVVLAALRA